MGEGKPVRAQDETLRWSDIAFRRLAGIEGITVQVVFKHLKGHRDPYRQQNLPEQKTITFLPGRSTGYESDLSCLLLGLGISRGLFNHESIDDVLNDPHNEDTTNPEVGVQAVFVRTDHGDAFLPDVPSRSTKFN